MASGRGPGRFRRGRRALQGRDPAHAPLRAGFPVLEHRPGPAHARRERGVHVPGAAEPVRMAQGHARANRVRQRRGRGRRASGNGIRWARLFQAFQAHYGFDCPPVLPVRGSREGRRGGEGWHGPPQAVRAQTECVESGELQLPTARQMPGARQETHHAKDEEETRLFSEDRGALLPLPAKRFDVVTWRRMRTDKYGVGHDRRQAPLLHRRVPRAP